MRKALVSWAVSVGWVVALVLNLTTGTRQGERFWVYSALAVGGILAFAWQGAQQWLAARGASRAGSDPD